MDIVLGRDAVDFKIWQDEHPDLDFREVHFMYIGADEGLRNTLQRSTDALVHRYDVTPTAWRTGSDALHSCLQILHEACAIESNPDGWKKICPAS